MFGVRVLGRGSFDPDHGAQRICVAGALEDEVSGALAGLQQTPAAQV
jgi:hypothetical protein